MLDGAGISAGIYKVNDEWLHWGRARSPPRSTANAGNLR
jgi:hypothetical protein